jgi:long-chain acyl-CoA synthetase
MKTIIQMFDESVSKFANNTFLWEKKSDKFEPLTYVETKEQVLRLAAGLVVSGLKKDDKMALLSEGRNAWIIGELAILHTGAVNVPLSIKLEESNDLLFRLKHSESRFVMVSGSQLKKIRAIISDLPLVEKIIVLDPQATYEEKEIFIGDVYAMGDEYLSNPENRKSLIEAALSIQDDDLANISYTSGTTADPKGIMLSHRNYTANVEQSMSLIKITPNWSNLIILPLDHCFAHVAGFYSFMAYGSNVATVQVGRSPMETLKNIPINIKEFKPYVMMSVPALAKNFRKNIESEIKKKGKTVEKLFNHALKIGYEYNKEGWNKGGFGQAWKKPLLMIYDKLIFSKVRQNFGGNLRFFIGGGALLDIELQRFFYTLGIPMFQGYGLSEATPVISSNSEGKHKLGSSGYLVKPLDLKICDQEGKELPLGEKGEIVIRGENVMIGYWKNPVATAETIKDGWLYTGDMGYMDADGFLYVLGRFKSLLISSDGEKYSPEGIEEGIADKTLYIEQMMLYNNQDPYTIALIVPNKEALKAYVKEQNPDIDLQSNEAKDLMLDKLQEIINSYKAGGINAGEFPERWLPAAIGVLPEAFTEQNHLLNSTMKMVRGKIEERYKDFIAFLYTPAGKNSRNDRNREAF